jgi:hypothetical protein
VHFLYGATSLKQDIQRIAARVEELGGMQLIVVDTARSFFEGDDENSNKQMGDYARALRTLTQLPGRPCVLVNCHPSKRATDDDMQPVGGGSFVAEMDGNLTCMSGGSDFVELSWQVKLRGPGFAPLRFELKKMTTPLLVDSKGRCIMTVLARALTEDRYERRVAQTLSEEEEVLDALRAQPKASIAALAEALGWVSDGKANKSRVHRMLQRLVKDKLVRCYRGRYMPTKKGQKQ